MAGNRNSGSRRQSNQMRVLRGNPGGRRLPEPAPAVVRPGPDFDTPPSVLDDDTVAAAEWRRLAPVVRTSGLVTDADSAVLVVLCQQWSIYLDAMRRVRDEHLVEDTSKGQKQNAYLRVADRALRHCQTLWRELGLTPSSRSRLIAVPPAEPTASKWTGLI